MLNVQKKFEQVGGLKTRTPADGEFDDQGDGC
jgi:hypothetical protein